MRNDHTRDRLALAALACVPMFFASINHAFSHGFAGSRFFPATLSIAAGA